MKRSLGFPRVATWPKSILFSSMKRSGSMVVTEKGRERNLPPLIRNFSSLSFIEISLPHLKINLRFFSSSGRSLPFKGKISSPSGRESMSMEKAVVCRSIFFKGRISSLRWETCISPKSIEVLTKK